MSTAWDTLDDGLADPQWYRHGEPREVFTRLRDEDPVHWTPSPSYGRGFWAVTRYADVQRAMADQVNYSIYRDLRLPRTPARPTATELWEIGMDSSVTLMDPPKHTLFRQPMNKHFSVPQIGRMRSAVEDVVDGLIDSFGDSGEVDWVSQFAVELPTRVVLELLGVPKEDWAPIGHLIWQLLAPADPKFAVPGESPAETSEKAKREIASYGHAMALDRRRNPREDFVSVLAHAKVEGVPLDAHEITTWISVIIIAGLGTTRNAVAVGLWLFHENRSQLDLLLAEPDLMSTAVEEVLRYVSPIRSRLRVARFDHELAGTRIKAGDWVVPFLSSANMDERAFDQPEQFDIRRDPNPHIVFGDGPHKCLGRHLARLELVCAFTKFFKRFPDFHVPNASKPDWLVDHVTNGFSSLIVELGSVREPVGVA